MGSLMNVDMWLSCGNATFTINDKLMLMDVAM
jgi:hypothetical protein